MTRKGTYDVFDPDKPEIAKTVSAAGRSQAQNVNFGMNYPGTDDRQLVLNVMHWLTGLLK